MKNDRLRNTAISFFAKVRSHIGGIILVALLLGLTTVPVYAAEGKITVRMEYEGSALNGGTLKLYRVGDAILKDGSYVPELLPPYSESGVVLSVEELNKNGKKIAETLLKFAEENQLSQETSAQVLAGRAEFDSLRYGFYLVAQEKETLGYSNMSPFAVVLPQKNGSVWEERAEAIAKIERKNGGGNGSGGNGGNGGGSNGGNGNGGNDGGSNGSNGNGGNSGGNGGSGGSEERLKPEPSAENVVSPPVEKLPKTGEALWLGGIFRYLQK